MTFSRKEQLEHLKNHPIEWDLIVVGGGITGAGIFREAAHNGLKVLLVEQKDFAWGTSSRSSKMVHGGLRYLGSGQFGLANDSVKERQNLMTELPGLVEPLPFMMGHYKGVFPGPWIFNKLLAIYDFMAGKRYRKFFKKGINDYWVPGLKMLNLKGVTKFADAVTDDARLVLRVIQAGQQDQGLALNYLKAIKVLKQGEIINGVRLQDLETQEEIEVRANVVINATGVWTDELRAQMGAEQVIRPLRGSHLVVPYWRLPVAYSVSFFHPEDKRPVFVFPWEGVTVIGTTDLDHRENMESESSISNQEVNYLLDAVNQQFPQAKIQRQDVRSTWSGVRPVVSKTSLKQGRLDHPEAAANPSDEKREHVIWDDKGLISVAGGKLTTYRLIALDVLRKAAPYLNLDTQAFAHSSHFSEALLAYQTPNFLTMGQKKRLEGRYGDQVKGLYRLIQEEPSLAAFIGTTDTLWVELSWACQSEQVMHLDDLLLRRTRIGLLLENGGSGFLPEIKRVCQSCLRWDEAKWLAEVERYQAIIHASYGLPE